MSRILCKNLTRDSRQPLRWINGFAWKLQGVSIFFLKNSGLRILTKISGRVIHFVMKLGGCSGVGILSKANVEIVAGVAGWAGARTFLR